MAICGAADIEVTIGGATTTLPVLAAEDLRPELVLGLDWCQREDAVLDFSRRCVHFGRHPRQTAYWDRRGHEPPTPSEPPNVAVGLSEERRPEFQLLLEQFASLFTEAGPMTTTPATNHEIRLTDRKPIAVAPHRYSQQTQRQIFEQVEEMLAAGVVEPSTSPYSSPVVMIRKKDGTPRFCVDYRRVNQVTESLPTRLPVISEALRDLGRACVFSTIDLRSGYWQIPMAEESKPVTAFTTPDGAAYQFRVMPFGLKNAPGTFQRLMAQEVLAGYLHHFALVYLDDIIVYSTAEEEHLYHLRLVFERLERYGLKCAPAKCRFGDRTTKYLGFVVSDTYNSPHPDYMKKVLEASRPNTRRQVRKFMGLCNWIRDYLPRFAELAAPITDLLATRRPFRWTTEADAAFQRVKDACSGNLRLHRPDFTLPFTLQTDASLLGISAVLHQDHDGQRRVIAYASATLNAVQKRYHINELECLAVVWAVKKFRPYLEDGHFTLRTDSRSLTWLHSMKDQRAKLTRWALSLQDLSFQIKHCPGEANELPDALSRTPDDVPALDPYDADRLVPPVLGLNEVPTLAEEVAAAQREDPDLRPILDHWENLPPHGPYQHDDQQFLERYVIHEGALYRRTPGGERLCAPEAVRPRILHLLHDSREAGHPGAEETQRAIERHYYWPTLGQHVRHYVRGCLVCSCVKRGPPQPNAPLQPRQPARPWEVVSVDIMGPYERTPRGNRFILVASDLYSKWTEAVATTSSSAATIVTFLETFVFCRFGYPKYVLTDQGVQFRSRQWDRACARWRAQHWTTPVYHPQANPVERRNQEIKKTLRTHLHNRPQHDWDQYLSVSLFALRTRRNAATGVTPGYALFGYDIRRPGDWYAEEQQPAAIPPAAAVEDRERRVLANRTRYVRRYEGRGRLREYRPGDQVLVREFRRQPLGPKWTGPHAIESRRSDNTYWVSRGERRVKVHVNHLRPAPPLRERQEVPVV